METERKRYLHVSFSLFKSYYVVWKLLRKVWTNFLDGQFKSYYVVWKPQEKEEKEDEEEKFKSYYVVWKLFCVSPTFEYPVRLNRTMQYGNYFRDFQYACRVFRLNRTMQYGNCRDKKVTKNRDPV